VDLVQHINLSRSVDEAADSPLLLPPEIALAFGLFRLKSGVSSDILAAMRVVLPVLTQAKPHFLSSSSALEFSEGNGNVSLQPVAETRFENLLLFELLFSVLVEMAQLGMKSQTQSVVHRVEAFEIPDSLAAEDKSIFFGGLADIYSSLGIIPRALENYTKALNSHPFQPRWAYALSRLCRSCGRSSSEEICSAEITALKHETELLLTSSTTSLDTFIQSFAFQACGDTVDSNVIILVSNSQLEGYIRVMFEWAAMQLDQDRFLEYCSIMIPLVYNYRERLYTSKRKHPTHSVETMRSLADIFTRQVCAPLDSRRDWLDEKKTVYWKIMSSLCTEAAGVLESIYSTEEMFNTASRIKACIARLTVGCSVLSEDQTNELMRDEELVHMHYDGSWVPEAPLDDNTLYVPLVYNSSSKHHVVSCTECNSGDGEVEDDSEEINIKHALSVLADSPNDARALNTLMRNAISSNRYEQFGLESLDLTARLEVIFQSNRKSTLPRLYSAMCGVSQRKFNEAFDNYLEAFSCDPHQPATSLALAVTLMLFAGQKIVRER
jgi:tetratricopeptide (TPR) repeat protein